MVLLEFLVAAICDLKSVYAKGSQENLSKRSFVWFCVRVIATHPELACWHEDHSWWWRLVFLHGQRGSMQFRPRLHTNPCQQQQGCHTEEQEMNSQFQGIEASLPQICL